MKKLLNFGDEGDGPGYHRSGDDGGGPNHHQLDIGHRIRGGGGDGQKLCYPEDVE